MKVLIAGDFAPRARLAKQIEDRKYSEVFQEDIREIIKSADFSLVNFESPITEKHFKPIPKCGPNLHCTYEAAEAVKYAGFTGVTMANNHILDFGVEGLQNSVECCKAQGLDVVGVGNNLEDAEKILYIAKYGMSVAVINCCEHEFSVATQFVSGANPLNPIKQFYAIQNARKKADYVLVIVHGGHEHYQLPSPRMQETYRFFVDAGADVVVNHHQHCYSGYEKYKGKLIFYGLGNFCFDISPTLKNMKWNYGYMVELIFKDSIEFKLYPYNQCGDRPIVELLESDAFDVHIEELNSIISNEELLRARTNAYYKENVAYERSLLEPYSGRIMNRLLQWGLLPYFFKGKKMLNVLNHIECESHRDKLLFVLDTLKSRICRH